jgi:hypothetical protein
MKERLRKNSLNIKNYDCKNPSVRMEKHFSVEWDCGQIKFFSVKTLKEMVHDQGFRNIRFKFAGRLPFLWKSMVLCARKES